jgi:hypothetical protein
MNFTSTSGFRRGPIDLRTIGTAVRRATGPGACLAFATALALIQVACGGETAATCGSAGAGRDVSAPLPSGCAASDITWTALATPGMGLSPGYRGARFAASGCAANMRFIPHPSELYFVDASGDRVGVRVGYAATVAVLKAADYGVPQLRSRLLIVGARDGQSFSFPAPTHAPLDAEEATLPA